MKDTIAVYQLRCKRRGQAKPPAPPKTTQSTVCRYRFWWGRRFRLPEFSVSKYEFQPELELPRWKRARDASIGRSDIARRRLEICLIQQIERLGAEFQAARLRPQPEILVQPAI